MLDNNVEIAHIAVKLTQICFEQNEPNRFEGLRLPYNPSPTGVFKAVYDYLYEQLGDCN